MFIVKPLARNLPNPVPYPFEQLSPSYRYITTLSTRYEVTDASVFVVRMASTQEKTIILPASPVTDRFLIIQDLGGAGIFTPFTIRCGGSKTFVDGTVLKTYTSGNTTIVLRYNGSAYDIVEVRDMWQQSYVTLSMPNIIPIRNEDTTVEAIDNNMLIVLGNPQAREVVISKPASTPDDPAVYAPQFFVILDAVGTAGSYPIRLIFDDCTCNGNASYTVTGNNLMVMLKSQTDGNYLLWEFANATFSDYTVAPNDKIFGLITVDNPYYSSAIRGFSTITPPTTGGKLLTLGA